MPKFQTKRFEQLLADMIARVIARTDMSDVSDVSVVKHVLAAAARADDEQYYQMVNMRELFSIDSATGEDLDERAKEIQPADITRRDATKATGSVVFSRNGTTGSVTIPIGTKVKTAGGVVFTTTTTGNITPASGEQISGHGVGRDSNLVSVVADVPGAAGNVVASTVVKFVSKPAGVDEVTNPSKFANGSDEESDDSFRNRIRNYVRALGRSTVVALENGVLGAQDPSTGATILFSKAVEDEVSLGNVTLYIDDGTGTAETTASMVGENVTLGLSGPPVDSAVGGETVLYLDKKPIKDSNPFTVTSSTRGALTRNTHYTLNPASGQLVFDPALTTGEVITATYTYYQGLIALGQKIVDGDPNDRTTYPGIRAAGILVIVKTPQVLIQNVVCTLTVQDGFDQAATETLVRTAIRDYINNLPVSGDVVRAELFKRIMSVSGVVNVVLTTPNADVIILDNQLARTTDGNITVS